MKDVSFIPDGRTRNIGYATYKKSREELVLVRYVGKKSRVIVPYGVTAIGEEAFLNAPVSEVVLPPSIKSIGTRAFYSSKVKVVHLPNSTEIVYPRAFACSALKKIVVDNKDLFLYEEVFDHCYDLTEVDFSGTEEEWENVIRAQKDLSGYVVTFADGRKKQY